jgi:hypothetical protein
MDLVKKGGELLNLTHKNKAAHSQTCKNHFFKTSMARRLVGAVTLLHSTGIPAIISTLTKEEPLGAV